MYTSTKTWSPFKGCKFDCTYCVPSFQQQAKRQLHLCRRCYDYVPHTHPERLGKVPSAGTIFVAGNSDISFCPPAFTRQIITSIRQSGRARTFYLQSKRPGYFAPFLTQLPKTVMLVTSLETNRDAGYAAVSKAPLPSERYRQFRALRYPRKVVTIEPVMDFDVHEFSSWLIALQPEYVWLGYNSRPKQVQLPEPSEDKVRRLVLRLQRHDIEVRAMDLRGLALQGVRPKEM